MGAAKKIEMLPEETFIQDALRDGRAFKTEISLKAIGKPDTRFQARVETAPGQHLDMEHVARLGRILEELGPGGNLHPIVVFFNAKTKKYLVADGFHRFDAYRRARREAIPAYQIEGNERDALEYCTMCNRLAMKGRTKEDVVKAVEMLLNDETWWGRGDAWIADHVGCGPSTVVKFRSRMIATGKNEPQTVVKRNGRMQSYRLPKGDESRRINKTSPDWHMASLNGQKICGKTAGIVEAKLAAKLTAMTTTFEKRRKSLSRGAVNCFLEKMGFIAAFIGSGIELKLGLNAWHRPGIVCTACDLESGGLLPNAVGQLIAARRYKGDLTARMVVLCYPENGPTKLLDFYRAESFEFLTPEELAESLKTSGNRTIPGPDTP